MGALYLVGTPLGNLEDITLRALRTLREARLIAAEDTRRTAGLLAHYEIKTPLTSYTDAYARLKHSRQATILAALDEGDVAVVSDAGMPGLADPGYELVRAALDAGHVVSVIPGPTALVSALVASGLPSERCMFLGFLPRRMSERRRVLTQYAAEPATLVAYETPQRLLEALTDLHAVWGERQIVVARELTKLHETFWRGTISAAHAYFSANPPRGEITLVIAGAAPATPADWSPARIAAALTEARAAGASLRSAAQAVAQTSGWSKRDVYALALAAEADADDAGDADAAGTDDAGDADAAGADDAGDADALDADDAGEGAAAGADDAGEGAAAGADDAGEGAAAGADDAGEGDAAGADDTSAAGGAAH